MSSPSRRRRLLATAAAVLVLTSCAASPGGRSVKWASTAAAIVPGDLPVGCRIAARAASPSEASFVIAAGDLGQHADVAARFLTGCSKACRDDPDSEECVKAPGFYVPPAARAGIVHRNVKVEDYGPYFMDAKKDPSGVDLDDDEGIERGTVVVYAGHGELGEIGTYGYKDESPTELNGVSVKLDKVLLGNGEARYLLMFSCLVMAHGPQVCGNEPSFSCPQLFKAANDDRNALDHWRGRMGDGLRLACGGSSGVYSTEGPAAFWNGLKNQHLPIADAYLLAMSTHGMVPICVSRGVGEVTKTPLKDTKFETAYSLPEGEQRYLYAMYPVRGTEPAAKVVREIERRVGARRTSLQTDNTATGLPLLEVEPTELQPYLGPKFWQGGKSTLGFRYIQNGRLPRTKIDDLSKILGDASSTLGLAVHPRSGAGSIRFQLTTEKAAGGTAALMEVAKAFQVGVTPSFGGPKAQGVPPEIDAVQMEIIRAPEDSPNDVKLLQGCVYARLRVWVDAGAGNQFPVLDEGGAWDFRSCPKSPDGAGEWGIEKLDVGDGTQSLAYGGRPIAKAVPVPADTASVTAGEAECRAKTKLRNYVGEEEETLSRYEIVGHVIGYVAAPTHCGQERMQPVHRFHFARSGMVDEVLQIDVPVYDLATKVTGIDCSY